MKVLKIKISKKAQEVLAGIAHNLDCPHSNIDYDFNIRESDVLETLLMGIKKHDKNNKDSFLEQWCL